VISLALLPPFDEGEILEISIERDEPAINEAEDPGIWDPNGAEGEGSLTGLGSAGSA